MPLQRHRAGRPARPNAGPTRFVSRRSKPADRMPRRNRLDEVAALVPAILPSLLKCDFGNLASEVRRLEEAHVPALHLDVMDGHFVPNLTYGLPILAAVRKLTTLPLDVHLMTSNPADLLEQFVAAGADFISFHVEAVADPAALLRRARQLGVAAGVALNPATPIESIEPCLAECDFVLVMSVPAGFGGQPFDPVALDKLRRLTSLVPASTPLEVDGGVNADTIGRCAAAGARFHVVGSAIFESDDYPSRVAQLRRLASENHLLAGPTSCSTSS